MKLPSMLILAVLLCGCAKTTTTSLVTGRQETPVSGLGKTVVLTWFAFEGQEAKTREKTDKLRGIIITRFSGLAGTTLAPQDAFGKDLTPRTWRDASDMELVAAARAEGIDSVALVEVASCGGDLSIGLLPPAWAVATRFSYRLRLLDARSGTLVRSALRGQDRNGTFSVRGKKELFADFDADLAALLGATVANPEVAGR